MLWRLPPISFYQGAIQKQYQVTNQLLMDYGFFHTKQNYLPNGTTQNLPDGNNFTHQLAYVGLRSVLAHDTGLSFLVASHGIKKQVDEELHQTRFRISHLVLSMDLLFYEHPSFDFILDVQLDHPIYKVRSNHSVLFAEGDQSLLARWIVQSSFKDENKNQALLYFHSGLQFRNGGRSFLFVWRLGGTKVLFSPVGLGVEFFGFQSVLQKDKYFSDPTEKKDLIDDVNGGSQRFFYVDPQLMQYRAWLFFKSSIGELHLGSGNTFGGKRTAAGNEFFMKLVYNFLSAPSSPSKSKWKYKDLEKEKKYYRWFNE